MKEKPMSARDAARAKAEIEIEKILLRLEEEAGVRLGSVEVDASNFANCNVEIWFANEVA